MGSPRVITNENGAVKDRKDFSAFGEETASAQRSSNAEYTPPDQLRKNYTGYEKDGESGLEFAKARYYNPTHGRFTSVDPLTASASIKNPQTFNRYSYVLNSPYKFTDPLGLISQSTGACGNGCRNSDGGAGERGGYEDVSKNFLRQQISPPSPPPTPVKINSVNKTYEVTGATAVDAVADANTKATSGQTKKARAGETELLPVKQTFDETKDIKYNETTNAKTGEVTVVVETTNVTVEATIVTTLPNWADMNKATSSEQTKWDGFFKQLSNFEKEHTVDTTKRLHEYRDALIGLKVSGTGTNLESARQSAAVNLSAKITAAQNTLYTNYNNDGAKRHQKNGHTVNIRR